MRSVGGGTLKVLNAWVWMLELVRRSDVFGLTPPPSPGILTVFPSSSVCQASWLAEQGPKFRARIICRAAEQECSVVLPRLRKLGI